MERTTQLLEKAHSLLIRTHAVNEKPPILSRGLGSRVWDVEGKEYIDFVSGQICSTIGHNHPRIIEAVNESAAKMLHSSSWLLHEDAIELAEELSKLLPERLRKFVFKSAGGEANEVALHLAKMCTGNYEVLTLDRSYYGATAGARSSTTAFGHRGYGPTVPGSYFMPAPNSYRCPIRSCRDKCDLTCLEVGFAQYDSQTTGQPAAVLVEPIMSSGGMIEPPAHYYLRLQEEAHKRGMLVIFDEAQTGLGRVGSMFAFELYGIVPDILTLSKTIGGGIPLSATATGAEIEQAAFDKGFVHGSSHANDPLPARVGLAVLKVLQEENLPAQAAEKGDYLRKNLTSMAERYELIGDIRGRGLLMGVEFVRDRETREGAEEVGRRFNELCIERGLLVNIIRLPGANSVCRIAPPLTISYAELDRALSIMEDALAELTRKAPVGRSS